MSSSIPTKAVKELEKALNLFVKEDVGKAKLPHYTSRNGMEEHFEALHAVGWPIEEANQIIFARLMATVEHLASVAIERADRWKLDAAHDLVLQGWPPPREAGKEEA